VVIEKAVLVPLSDDTTEFTDQNDGTRTYGGMSDVIPNHKAILREDSGQVFYIGSNQYQPVQHRVVLAPVIEALTNNADIRIVSVNHGGRVYADFLDIRTVFIGDEEYRGGIRIINSLDGTYRLVIESIIHRTKTNSRLLLSQFLTTFYRRHILGSMDTNDFARAAREAVDSVHAKMRGLDRLTHINITEVAFRGLVQKLEMAERYKQLALDIWQTPEVVEMEHSDTAMAVVAILAYIGTHELARTLNEEALYKWQRNVDSVLSRTLMPYMGTQPSCSNHAAQPCPDYAPQAPAPTPHRLPEPTTPSFPPANCPSPPITNAEVFNQALTPEQVLTRAQIMRGQIRTENIDDLLSRLERDLQDPPPRENPPARHFGMGDRAIVHIDGPTTDENNGQEGRIISQNAHHDRFLLRFSNGAEHWYPTDALHQVAVSNPPRVPVQEREHDESHYDSMGKGGIASR